MRGGRARVRCRFAVDARRAAGRREEEEGSGAGWGEGEGGEGTHRLAARGRRKIPLPPALFKVFT